MRAIPCRSARRRGEGTAACLGTMDGRSGDRGCLRLYRSYVRAGCGGLSGRRSARGPQWRLSGASKVGLGGGTVYSVLLKDAFPTTIQAVDLSNDMDGLVQITAQVSYTNWEAVNGGQGWIQASGGLGSIANLF